MPLEKLIMVILHNIVHSFKNFNKQWQQQFCFDPFSRQRLWSTSYRSLCHQRDDSKTWEKLWRSKYLKLFSSLCSHIVVNRFFPFIFLYLTHLLPSAVTPPVFPTWECTWLTWPSSRRGHPTTLRTTWSTSPRWEW